MTQRAYPSQLFGCKTWLGGVALAYACTAGASGLYETGPAQDSSFVRFVNGTEAAVVVSNSKTKGKLELGTQGAARVSPFLPIRAGAKMAASIAVKNQKFDLEVVAKPGEFITVATVPNGTGGWTGVQMRETPSSFSATRASIAVFNFNPACPSAQVDSAGKADGIFKNATSKAVQRRLVSPVNATVQVSCAGKASGTPLDFGLLEPGERYSVFVLPTQAGGLVLKDGIETGQ